MIEINNLTGGLIDKNFLKKTAEKVLKKEIRLPAKKDLSIVLVGQARIKELNKRYRGKNYPTDVLSFQDKESWGEIVICPAEIRENAKKFKITFKNELTRVLIHGVLHLLGYDHEKGRKEETKMRKKEEYYFNI